MSVCEFCGIVQGEFESEELYSDESVIAVLHLKPAVPGQILLFTKEHYPIIEQVPDDVIGHIFSVANKLSVGLFESLGVQGTNIIIENGVAAGQSIPHFSVSIVPRNENDGMNLEWTPTKPSDDELDIAHAQLVEEANMIGSDEKKVVVEEEETKEETPPEGDYRMKQLKRVP
jgi:histidine triad (HIT) family protein